MSDAIGAENYWPWGLCVGDLNADGYDDVFITSGMNYPFRYGVELAAAERRTGSASQDAEFVLGVEPAGAERSPTRGSSSTPRAKTGTMPDALSA